MGGQRTRERAPRLYTFLRRIAVPPAIKLLSRYDVRGVDNVPLTGPVVLASNHVDNLDAAVIGFPLRRVIHFMGRTEVFREPIRGRLWRWAGAIPADGSGVAQAIAILRDGGCVAIYPEGTISPTLSAPRAGLGILAMRAKAMVVPIAVWGTEEVRLPRSLLRPTPVHVRYGEAIDAGAWRRGPGQAQALTDEVMRRIAAMLPSRYRGDYGNPADLPTAQSPEAGADGSRPVAHTAPGPSRGPLQPSGTSLLVTPEALSASRRAGS